MMFATIILLIGLIAIARSCRLPSSLNYRNRNDSTALVFAQRELDQMLDQPLNTALFSDSLSNTCWLGDLRSEFSQGGPVVVINNQALINFSAAPSPIQLHISRYYGSRRAPPTMFAGR